MRFQGLELLRAEFPGIGKGEEDANVGEKSMKKIEDTLRRIIVDQLGVLPERVTRDASFADELGADSLDMVNLQLEVENAFAIEIKDEGEKAKTFGDLLDLVANKCETETRRMAHSNPEQKQRGQMKDAEAFKVIPMQDRELSIVEMLLEQNKTILGANIEMLRIFSARATIIGVHVAQDQGIDAEKEKEATRLNRERGIIG